MAELLPVTSAIRCSVQNFRAYTAAPARYIATISLSLTAVPERSLSKLPAQPILSIRAISMGEISDQLSNYLKIDVPVLRNRVGSVWEQRFFLRSVHVYMYLLVVSRDTQLTCCASRGSILHSLI